MTTISVVNWSDGRIDDATVARACDQVSIQVAECAQAWGIEPWLVSFVPESEALAYSATNVMAIVPELDPGVAGYHNDVNGVIYGKVLVRSAYETSKTLSHECLEMLVDPDAKQWRSGVALEVCDPVEADVYEQGGVPLSNYVLPAWFETSSAGPYDRLGKVHKPLTSTKGGYQILGPENTHTVFAEHDVRLSFYRKLTNPDSRTLRRLRG